MQVPCIATPAITLNNTTLSSDSITICSGDNISLGVDLPTDVTGFSYGWSTGATLPSIVVAPDTNALYSVRISYSPACNDTMAIVVFVHPQSDTIHLSTTTCDSTATGTTQVLLQDQNGCDSIVINSITLLLPPAAPSAPADLLIGQNAPPFMMSVPEVPGATSYEWTVPPGVQILSGNGSNSIVIDWGGLATGGIVCVSALNECGSSSAACLQVSVDLMNAVNTPQLRGYALYPNPTSGRLHIVFSKRTEGTYLLLDLNGQSIREGQLQGETIMLDVEDLSQGIYILLLKTDAGLWTERVVKM